MPNPISIFGAILSVIGAVLLLISFDVLSNIVLFVQIETILQNILFDTVNILFAGGILLVIGIGIIIKTTSH